MTTGGERDGTYVVRKVGVHDDHKVARDEVEPVDVRRPAHRQATLRRTRSGREHVPEAEFPGARAQDLQR